jgi:hypothetical protein
VYQFYCSWQKQQFRIEIERVRAVQNNDDEADMLQNINANNQVPNNGENIAVAVRRNGQRRQ